MVILAYSSDLKRTLGIEAIDSKEESEVAAVRKLIERLDLKGVIVTGDALHATIKTMEVIKKSGNEYVLQVKKNRPLGMKRLSEYAGKSSQKMKVVVSKRTKDELKLEKYLFMRLLPS